MDEVHPFWLSRSVCVRFLRRRYVDRSDLEVEPDDESISMSTEQSLEEIFFTIK